METLCFGLPLNQKKKNQNKTEKGNWNGYFTWFNFKNINSNHQIIEINFCSFEKNRSLSLLEISTSPSVSFSRRRILTLLSKYFPQIALYKFRRGWVSRICAVPHTIITAVNVFPYLNTKYCRWLITDNKGKTLSEYMHSQIP